MNPKYSIYKLHAKVEAMEKFLGMSEAEHAQMGKLGREKMEREYDRGIVIRAYLEEIQKAEK